MIISKKPTTKFKYEFDFDFSYDVLTICRAIKMRHGAANMNFNGGKWRFNNLAILDELKKVFPSIKIDVSMHNDMKQYSRDKEEKQDKIERAHEIKKAVASDLDITGIKGELYPYQKLGVEFFINNGGRGILADTMGLGKTLQTLAYIVHAKKKKTIVICPASVKYSWESEVKKWTKLKSKVLNSKDFSEFNTEVFSGHDVFIINYDLIRKFLPKLLALRWDCMVCDEFHYIKNSAALRTKATKKLGGQIESILLLSGTPILNRPVELFNGLNVLEPTVWNDYYQYTSRYCGAYQGHFGWDARGATHIDELQQKTSHYFLRRNKDEVLSELPPKRFMDNPVELEAEVQSKYRLAETAFIKYLREVKKKKISESSANEQAYKLARLNELRQLASEGKVYAAKEIIENVIDNGEKILVFSAFNKPLEDLKEYFGDSAIILTGKTSSEDRRDIIEKFQKDKKTKIFLGGIKSAGVGITLTAASSVLFVDYSWVPADHAQAVDRAHRIGQKADSISVYQLYSKDTIDEYMMETIKRKEKIFNQLINGVGSEEKQTKLSMVGDVIKSFEQKLCT